MTQYPNGKVPAAARTVIDSAGRTLLTPTAKAWLWVVAEVNRRYGWSPQPSPGRSANRTIADQEYLFNQNYTTDYNNSAKFDKRYWPGHGVYWRKKGTTVAAAVPGTSNHGYAVAIDSYGLGGFAAEKYKQFADVATEVGFNNSEGRSIGEFWHWVHDGVTLPPKPKPPVPVEDDMPETKSYTTAETQPIKTPGTWQTVKFTDEGGTSIAVDPKSFTVDVKIRLSGVAEGEVVRARVFRGDWNATTETFTRTGTYDLVERVGTSGDTFIDLVQIGGHQTPSGKNSNRVRVEVQVPTSKGASIIKAAAKTQTW
jgi:hypothetical protein